MNSKLQSAKDRWAEAADDPQLHQSPTWKMQFGLKQGDTVTDEQVAPVTEAEPT